MKERKWSIRACDGRVTLPTHPLELIAEGASLPVPLLIGSNRDEWRLFTILLGGNVEEVKAGLSQPFSCLAV